MALLSTDPELSVAVFRTACHPPYSRRRVPRDLGQAAMRLGMAHLDNVVLESELRRSVFARASECERLHDQWRLALTTAHLCVMVGRHFDHPHPQRFLAGLIHQVGLTLMLNLALTQRRPIDAQGWATAEPSSRKATAWALHQWDLPEEVQTAIAQLHAPEHVEVGALTHIVRLGRALAYRVLGVPGFPPLPHTSVEALGSAASETHGLLVSAERLVQSLAPAMVRQESRDVR